MKKNVSNKIKILNFIFTLSIVLYHYRSIEGYNIDTNVFFDNKVLGLFMSYIENIVGAVSMTFFFLISAILFYYNIKTSKEAINKMKNRLKSLLVPYCVWTIIVIIYRIVLDRAVPFTSIKEFFKIIFLAPLDGPLWYVLALLILMIPAPLIVKLKDRKVLSFFVLSGFVLLIRKIPIPGCLNEWWWLDNLFTFLIAYTVGIYIGLNFQETVLKEKYNVKTGKFIGLIGLIIINCLIFSMQSYKEDTFWVYIIVKVICIWLIFSGKFLNKELSKCFNCSFFMYTMHQPILIPIINRITMILLNGMKIYGYQIILIKIVGVFLLFLFSYLLYLLVKKLVPPKVFFLFTGGRG